MRRFKTIAVMMLLLLFWGCDSLLDTEPQQAISEELALSTDSNVKTALAGSYSQLGGYYLYGGQFYMLPDLMAVGQDAQWTGTYEEPGQIYQKDILVNNGFVSQMWLDAYATINTTNNVISALDVVDDNDRDRVEGEARFVRAVTYFQLVRLFAKDYNDGDPTSNLGIPIVLDPTREVTDNDYVSRNTVQEVYDQVITDLEFAYNNLPASNGFYADAYAAQAFLARVYLQMGDYGSARDAANDVIANGGFGLNDDYSAAFNNSDLSYTDEDIFFTRVTTQDGVNTLHTFYASQQENGGRGDIEVSSSHLALYYTGNATTDDDDDERYSLFYSDPGTGEIRVGKWKEQYGNVNVIRLAEMYLIRAEANFREGTNTGADPIDDINTIRARANIPEYGPTHTLTLQEILDERYKELAFEGHFLFDLKRLQGSVGTYSWDANELVFPIPQREMDVNDNLVQNDGYGN
jgi:hypothetical protein